MSKQTAYEIELRQREAWARHGSQFVAAYQALKAMEHAAMARLSFWYFDMAYSERVAEGIGQA